MTRAGVGLLTGLALILYGTLFRRLRLSFSSPAGWGFYALLAAGIVVGEFLAAGTGPAGFASGFTRGVITGLAGSLLYAGWLFRVNRWGDQGPLRRIIEKQRERLEARPGSPGLRARRLRRLDLLARPGPFAVAVFLQLTVFGIVLAAAAAFLS